MKTKNQYKTKEIFNWPTTGKATNHKRRTKKEYWVKITGKGTDKAKSKQWLRDSVHKAKPGGFLILAQN